MVHLCVHVYVCTCVCMCVHMCAHPCLWSLCSLHLLLLQLPYTGWKHYRIFTKGRLCTMCRLEYGSCHTRKGQTEAGREVRYVNTHTHARAHYTHAHTHTHMHRHTHRYTHIDTLVMQQYIDILSYRDTLSQ